MSIQYIHQNFQLASIEEDLSLTAFEPLLDFLTWDISVLDFFHHELDSSCFELLLDSLIWDFSDFELEYLLSELLDDY